VLVGAAVGAVSAVCVSSAAVIAATCAAVLFYLFGLADNDILGAPTDRGRPLPNGEITRRAAVLARAFCLMGALVSGAAAGLPAGWWVAAGALVAAVIAYNRLKLSLLMGLCRGLNVVCGALAVAAAGDFHPPFILKLTLVAAVWTVYIAAVTAYSAGEETDPAKKRRVGLLIGALIHLQISTLAILHLLFGGLLNFLAAGAVLLLVLRFLKHLLPKVSAS
jgi:4-hydroxybenzoate polyprenyltransferase